jgi:hypothetical protein
MSERGESQVERTGQGIANALQRAFPATTGERIAAVYPPDQACDARLDGLIEQLDQIHQDKESRQ